MTPFLYCNIWCIDISITYNNFYYVSRVYFYNSLSSDITEFPPEVIHIPEFEIHNLHLLQNVDYNIINTNSIPILKNTDNNWEIDLTYYENFKLQSNHV